MAKPKHIELGDGTIIIPILYEDRAIMAIDKPAGWLLAPDSWDRTGRNLQLAIQSSLNAGDYWARSRNLKYLRFVHRLDADTGGVLLLAKSPGALRSYSELFESRRVEKYYVAGVDGIPKHSSWTCRMKLSPKLGTIGQMKVDERHGKEAETHFRVLQTTQQTALVEARPSTGRTHQIRVHLAASGHPVLGDPLYHPKEASKAKAGRVQLALRAVKVSFPDPFQKRTIHIEAPTAEFLKQFSFDCGLATLRLSFARETDGQM
ncbi:MAG: RluA family pseudouridine synthase [Verrucomicrobia bacterium]|nr:RluA family pseudouridine synthase [Verrucomicrobiota bacterium]